MTIAVAAVDVASASASDAVALALAHAAAVASMRRQPRVNAVHPYGITAGAPGNAKIGLARITSR
ncbi:MAG TPA: hypothetical protein PKJ79_14890 [Quisquiliibacterium sp.]|nr:hypothetical protein [Quisquiliibacterium sp.]